MSNKKIFVVCYAHSSVETFADSLEKRVRAKVDRLIALLSYSGPTLGMPFSKKVAPKLYELRILGSPNVRFFYAFSGNTIWLVHGISKKRDAIPAKDIALALKRLSLLRI